MAEPTAAEMDDGRRLMERLRSGIRDVPDFPRAGVLFKDISQVLADPQRFSEAIDAVVRSFQDSQIDAVAGIESRGFILGGAVAYLLGVGFVPVRKEGKLPRRTITAAYSLEYGEAVLEIHDDAVTRGARVLVVDDLLATGGTVGATIGLLEQLGAEVVGAAFLVELSGLGGADALGNRRRVSLVEY